MNRLFSGELFRLKIDDKDSLSKEHRELHEILTPQEREELGENYLDAFVCVYIDDIIVFTSSPEEHEKHLRKVFDRLTQFDFLISSPKSFFAQEQVEYLGHIVSAKGVHVNPEKVKAIKEWPTPQTQTDVRFWDSVDTTADS